MSKPSPERFCNAWWVIGDVIGWIGDRDPAQFGRIATVADLPPLIFEPDSEVRESRPEIMLLRALERGDIVAYTALDKQPITVEFWQSKNEGDLHALFARGYSFQRDAVLAILPPRAELLPARRGPPELDERRANNKAAVYHTGLPGRPTSWQLIEAECRRRYAAGETYQQKGLESPAAWARGLLAWLQERHPMAPLPKDKTLTNKLSPLLHELTAGRPM
jgi:hypothetical protein